MDWNRVGVEEAIKDILAENLGVEAAEITPESNIEGDLGADSLDEAEIAMDLEAKFQIEIPDEEAAQIKTVQQAVDKVCEILNVTE